MSWELERPDEGFSASPRVDGNDGVWVVGSKGGLSPSWGAGLAPVDGVPWFSAALAVSASLYGEAVVALPIVVGSPGGICSAVAPWGEARKW